MLYWQIVQPKPAQGADNVHSMGIEVTNDDSFGQFKYIWWSASCSLAGLASKQGTNVCEGLFLILLPCFSCSVSESCILYYIRCCIMKPVIVCSHESKHKWSLLCAIAMYDSVYGVANPLWTKTWTLQIGSVTVTREPSVLVRRFLKAICGKYLKSHDSR